MDGMDATTHQRGLTFDGLNYCRIDRFSSSFVIHIKKVSLPIFDGMLSRV